MSIPSEPNPQLLERDLARANIQLIALDVVDATRDAVNEGTQLLARLVMVTGRSTPPRADHTSLLLLLRHVIEQADAVDELLRAGIFAPTALHVRAILEAHMQMLYMLGERVLHAPPLDPAMHDVDPLPADPGTGKPVSGQPLDELREQRGLAYLVAEYRRQLEVVRLFQAPQPWLRRIMGNTGAGQTILSDPAYQTALGTEEVRLTTVLADAVHQPIDQAFTTTRGKRRFDPAWYEINGGPASVRALATSVGLLGAYDLFYSPASAIMHAANVSGQLGTQRAAGGHSVAQLRSPHLEVQTISTFFTELLQISFLSCGICVLKRLGVLPNGQSVGGWSRDRSRESEATRRDLLAYLLLRRIQLRRTTLDMVASNSFVASRSGIDQLNGGLPSYNRTSPPSMHTSDAGFQCSGLAPS